VRLCLHINTSANSNDCAFIREVEGDVQHVVGYFQTMPQLINSSTDLDVDGIRSSLDSQGVWIQNRANFGIFNVRNEDEKCFLWAVLSCLHEASLPITKNASDATDPIKHC